MRGEYARGMDCRALSGGSSPHARGILFLRKIRRLPYRFIPACAGNTAKCRKKGKVLKVHPRMRGEYCLLLMLLANNQGSSPHARGIQQSAKGLFQYVRFIPACAGNTHGSSICNVLRRVHPRMRGEYQE